MLQWRRGPCDVIYGKEEVVRTMIPDNACHLLTVVHVRRKQKQPLKNNVRIFIKFWQGLEKLTTEKLLVFRQVYRKRTKCPSCCFQRSPSKSASNLQEAKTASIKTTSCKGFRGYFQQLYSLWQKCIAVKKYFVNSCV